MPEYGIRHTEKQSHYRGDSKVTDPGCKPDTNGGKNIDAIDRLAQGDAKPHRSDQSGQSEGKSEAVLNQQHHRTGADG